MAFKIVRNDITKMNTEAIVNTANDHPTVGTGCDHAVYETAGYEELLSYRIEKIGFVPEGDAFITPGFHLQAKYIIHAVSPLYTGGEDGEEEKLRSCYRKALQLAKEHEVRSIAFPLISTGSFGYPKEEGMRIAVDEIHAFLLQNEMDVYLVVFDDQARSLGKKIDPDLEEYIDRNYVDQKKEAENGMVFSRRPDRKPERPKAAHIVGGFGSILKNRKKEERTAESCAMPEAVDEDLFMGSPCAEAFDFETEHESKLNERMKHISDTFSEYLLYLIEDKKMKNADVYKRAIVDKKIFSKIKNNPGYHPQKLTALCLCVGARLNLDESKDLLARAGYALSPCDKTDIIFSYFIENEIYDMIELDIQLEEHGLPCIIS